MTKRSLWPAGLTGRVILVLILAVTVQFLAASLLIRAGESHLQRQDLGKRIAEQLLIAERIVESADDADREALLDNLSTIHTRLRLVAGPPDLPSGMAPGTQEVARSIIAFEPALADKNLRLTREGSGLLDFERKLEGAIEIDDGVWIRFTTEEPVAEWLVYLESSLRIGFVALLVLGSAVVLVRTLGAPLRRLSADALLIGTSSRIPFDEEAGPRELREVSRALNSMQERLADEADRRTQALLAVGHDLRTPLARLRLRIATIDDAEERSAAQNDIDQMTRMLQELLDFFETGETRQAREPSDLSSLCQTVGEMFADLGHEIEFSGPERLTVPVVHDHVVRAVENLVDNAIKYGGSARIVLTEQGEYAVIAIEDRGPGIPPEDIARVMRPFERRDVSRQDRHQGMGLGLSIADNVAVTHGGRLELANRQIGGLRAALLLPKK